MAPAAGMTWDADADRKLLLGILKMQNISVDFDAMAEYMTTDEKKCTASAIQNRVKKLKAMSKEGSAGSDEGTPKPKATPRKRNKDGEDADTPTSKKAKGKQGGKGKPADAENEDDDEGDKKDVVKKEAADDED